MAEHTEISWTDSTWNVITGCSIRSPGCTNCYAMRLAGTRLKHHPSRAGLTREVNGHPVWTGEVRLNAEWLDQPLRWKRPRNIFVVAHGDFGHEDVPRAWQLRVLDVMRQADWHRYQVLTKRPEVLLDLLRGVQPMSHIWIGSSVERQPEANQRLWAMDRIGSGWGWNTWVSYEPALGVVTWSGWEFLRGMVSGGESGPGARQTEMAWHAATRDWCAAYRIPFHFKQIGAWKDGQLVGKKAAGRLLDGREHNALPWQAEAGDMHG